MCFSACAGEALAITAPKPLQPRTRPIAKCVMAKNSTAGRSKAGAGVLRAIDFVKHEKI